MKSILSKIPTDYKLIILEVILAIATLVTVTIGESNNINALAIVGIALMVITIILGIVIVAFIFKNKLLVKDENYTETKIKPSKKVQATSKIKVNQLKPIKLKISKIRLVSIIILIIFIVASIAGIFGASQQL